jgi:hypothetical protein
MIAVVGFLHPALRELARQLPILRRFRLLAAQVAQLRRAFLALAFCLFGGTLVVLAVSGWLRKSSTSGKTGKKKKSR